jgi:hypothetical protein
MNPYSEMPVRRQSLRSGKGDTLTANLVASREERILKKVWVGVVADKNKFQRRFAYVGLSDRSITSSHEATEMFPINR